MSAERRDVVIVGAGVIGLSIAFELQRRGRQVLVLERGRPGGGATRAAGGMLAPVSEADVLEPELIAFGQDSLAGYADFVAEVERAGRLSCRYQRPGTLWVALRRDDEGELERLSEILADKGLATERRTAAEVLESEPHVSPRVLGGLFIADDHQVDPRVLTAALVAALEAAGGEIRSGVEVQAVDPDGGAQVRTRDASGATQAIVARQLVWATGATEAPSCPQASELGLRPVKGQLLRLAGPRLIASHLRTPEVYLIPREDGELLVGGTVEEAGYDTRPQAGAVRELLRHAWEVLPGIDELEFREVSVGLRPALDDHRPRIGPVGDGVFVALGHFRHGVLLAPATARHLADWMCDGRPSEVLLPFRPDAAARGDVRG